LTDIFKRGKSLKKKRKERHTHSSWTGSALTREQGSSRKEEIKYVTTRSVIRGIVKHLGRRRGRESRSEMKVKKLVGIPRCKR